MGFEYAIGPPITTSNIAYFYSLESVTFKAKSHGFSAIFEVEI